MLLKDFFFFFFGTFLEMSIKVVFNVLYFKNDCAACELDKFSCDKHGSSQGWFLWVWNVSLVRDDMEGYSGRGTPLL